MRGAIHRRTIVRGGDVMKMNRRKFLQHATAAAVAVPAIALGATPQVAKFTHSVNKLPSDVVTKLPSDARAYFGGRQWHQDQLSVWMRNQVDEAVFNKLRRKV